MILPHVCEPPTSPARKLRLFDSVRSSKARILMLACGALIAGQASAVTFEGSLVPIRVRSAMCDSAPRIFVEFADSSKNIWYPANAGESSKYFLATALAAKVAGQPMYFLGTDDTVTSYCITSGRQVLVFGASDE